MKTTEVKTYDGTFVKITENVVSHIERKHPEVLSVLSLNGDAFFDLLCNLIGKPHEAYVDSAGPKYFTKKLFPLH